MYPMIPFGPLSLPTEPVLALLAIWVGLDVLARAGRRWQLNSDELFNLSLLALAAGLLAARLWNVVQYWPIYRDELLLMLSVRPGGFSFWPGLVTATVVGYGYMLRRALAPAPVAAALAMGGLVAGIVCAVSGFLIGTIIGLPSRAPWAMPYFGELRHPVALYQALGLLLLLVGLWLWPSPQDPARVVWMAGLGYSLLRLFTDAYLADPATIAGFRTTQVIAFIGALACVLLLARRRLPDSAAAESHSPSATS